MQIMTELDQNSEPEQTHEQEYQPEHEVVHEPEDEVHEDEVEHANEIEVEPVDDIEVEPVDDNDVEPVHDIEVEHPHEKENDPEDVIPENSHPGDKQDHADESVAGGDEKWPGWPGESVFRMLVPALKVGSIIGRKGEYIKKTCEETKARIKILDGPPGTRERAVSKFYVIYSLDIIYLCRTIAS